jgi:hypothetical protein
VLRLGIVKAILPTKNRIATMTQDTAGAQRFVFCT